MRLRSSRRTPRVDPMVLELEVGADTTVRLDHACPGAGIHRLIGVELTPAEVERLRRGGSVSFPVACDRCLWERRIVLRQS